MNVLFLTTGTFHSINEQSMYPDLLREFKNNGHEIYVVSTNERRLGKETEYIEEDGAHLLRVKTGNLTKTNLLEKGLSTLLVESQFKSAIKKYLSNVKIDLVIYSTPPITLVSAIEYVKKRDGAKTYLLLKDIFPQNAVDIGLISESGLKGSLYKHFKKKEKRLYAISDHIACMSQANVDYVVKHNPEVDSGIVEVCPNSIDVIDKSVSAELRYIIREKYGIPQGKNVFVYGGNLGKPQGIPFLIRCLRLSSEIEKAYFLIVGDGTEYGVLENYVENENPKNVKLMKRLPKEEFDTMVGACDVGLIFLDHRFTIPNFPSRLLAYMQAKLPVLACTDPYTDVGKVITEGGFGWWCESNDAREFTERIKQILKLPQNEMEAMKKRAYQYLCDNYNSERAYQTILKRIR